MLIKCDLDLLVLRYWSWPWDQLVSDRPSAIPGPAIDEIVVPVTESIGVSAALPCPYSLSPFNQPFLFSLSRLVNVSICSLIILALFSCDVSFRICVGKCGWITSVQFLINVYNNHHYLHITGSIWSFKMVCYVAWILQLCSTFWEILCSWLFPHHSIFGLVILLLTSCPMVKLAYVKGYMGASCSTGIGFWLLSVKCGGVGCRCEAAFEDGLATWSGHWPEAYSCCSRQDLQLNIDTIPLNCTSHIPNTLIC
jgi:hypothetical protein